MFPLKKQILLSIVCVMITTIARSQVPSVRVFTDSSRVELASQVKLTIEAVVNSGQKTVFPSFNGDTIMGGIEIVKRLKPDTIRNADNSITFSHSFIVTSFDDSTYTVPRLPIKVAKDTLYTQPFQLTFTLLQVDSTFIQSIDTTQELRVFDIVPIKETPWTFKEFWSRFGSYILVVLLVALLTAIATYLFIRYRKKQPIIPVSKPKEPADVVAKKRLAQLENLQLWQNDKPKEYYSSLTEILKSYISERYGYSVMESTSRETLKVLDKYLPKPSESFEKIRFIFETADPVKFAKLLPLPDENERCMVYAYEFVENTRLQPEVEVDKPLEENAVVNDNKNS